MKYKLGDICTITKGATGIMKAIPGAYTMITLGEADKTHNEYQFDDKAVIIPLVSSTGHGHASMKRVKYFEGKFALGNILCAVIPKDENFVLAKYLHIYLHWNREELLVSQMKGMANVSLSMNKIAEVMVAIPSIEKQIEIVELERKLLEKELDADLLFADQLSQLQNLNQTVLHEAVQGQLVQQDSNDEPARELLNRIKANNAKSGKKEKLFPPVKPEEIPFEIPESWVWCRLGEIAENVEYGTSQKAEMSSENIPVLRMNNIQSGELDYSNLKYVSENIDDLPRLFLVNGDMLFNRTNSYELVGKTAVYRGPNNSMTFASYLIRVQFDSNIISEFYSNYINSPICRETQLEPEIIQQNGQANFNGTKLKNILIPLPPLSEQIRIVTEMQNQCAKIKQLKEHIIATQQATEQLLKALLHQAFEVKEKEKPIARIKGKVIELKPDTVNWDSLTEEPFKKYADHPVNNIQNTDWEMAIMVACMKNKLGVTYGDVGLQKNVFNTNNLQPIFSKQYGFINSNFGTYSHELKDDLKRNPYLISQKVANNKEVYAINPKYSKEILNKLSAPENKGFVQAINRMLSIYEHPFINKETDKIELYNTVLKVALDKSTTHIGVIYQGMKDWKIKQTGYKTKAEKFTKPEAEKMLKLLIDKKILK